MPTDTAAGQITLHSLSYTEDGPEYNLSYNDLPGAMAGMDPETAATVLEGSIKGASQGNEILGQQTVTVSGHPGIRGEIDMDMNHAWYMSVITPKRQYQLVMVTTDQGKDTFGPDAQRAQVPGELVGALVQLRVSKVLTLKSEGNVLRRARDLFLKHAENTVMISLSAATLATFIGSPPMNFLPAEVDGTTVTATKWAPSGFSEK